MVDTNPMRFLSGLASIEETLSALEKEDRLALLVLQEDRLWTDPRVLRFLEGRFAPAAVFEESGERVYLFIRSAPVGRPGDYP